MPKFHIENETEGGWSRWVPPLHKGYRMACCDCALVHNMEFKVVHVTKTMKDGSWLYEDVKGNKLRVMFRAQRNKRSTSALRRKKK